MIFIKPSGAEVEVNANSHDAAIALGWIPKESIPVVSTENVVAMPKRRGRPPKNKDEQLVEVG